MKKSFGIAALGIASLLVAGTSFASLSQSQRTADFNELVTIIERNYAPLQWKRQSIQLNWSQHVQTYRTLVQNSASDHEFFQNLAKFLSGLQDAHVHSEVPSSFEGTLGFVCDYVDGKVVIETIDRLRLPAELFPFEKGDELVAIGGVSAANLMKDLGWAASTGNESSNRRITAARLTMRRQARGVTVPRGVTTVTVLPRAAAKPASVTATWINSGLPLIDQDDLSDLMNRESTLHVVQAAAESPEKFLQAIKGMSLMNLGLSASMKADFAKMGIADIGSPKTMFEGALPANFERLNDKFMIPSEITSGTYTAYGKKIGLIRLPAYDSAIDPLTQLPTLVQYLVFSLMGMSDVDVFVVDQTNNPGGAVDLVSMITSMFVDSSAKDVTFQIRPSMQWMDMFGEINTLINTILALDPAGTSELGKAAYAMQARFRYLEDETRDAIQSRRFVTTPVSLNLLGAYGLIQPQPKYRFEKPVLMLINEFDFSGGDAFPAIMKDNGRVTLFGARTSGAGGNVAEYGPLANSHFKFSCTESLMVRPNGQFIENLGVSPDIEYSVGMDDFLGNYRPYFEAFTKEAVKLAGGDPTVGVGPAAPAVPKTEDEAEGEEEEAAAAPAARRAASH